jgi:hypothetical protein
VEGNGNDQVWAGNGSNLIVGGLGKHHLRAGNGSNILIDGSVQLTRSGDTLAKVLGDWTPYGASAANVADIRARLKVRYNTTNANLLQAGSGLDWFWEIYALDHNNRKETDLLSGKEAGCLRPAWPWSTISMVEPRVTLRWRAWRQLLARSY